mmetsp:Transcript_36939/g.110384  ORF Transcript_36939/g.110384 Transcript_36939/m.110384 type:complete len:219 (+) Transcript_36939:203-859(+)
MYATATLASDAAVAASAASVRPAAASVAAETRLDSGGGARPPPRGRQDAQAARHRLRLPGGEAAHALLGRLPPRRPRRTPLDDSRAADRRRRVGGRRRAADRGRPVRKVGGGGGHGARRARRRSTLLRAPRPRRLGPPLAPRPRAAPHGARQQPRRARLGGGRRPRARRGVDRHRGARQTPPGGEAVVRARRARDDGPDRRRVGRDGARLARRGHWRW